MSINNIIAFYENLFLSLVSVFLCANAFGNPPDSTETRVKGKLYHVNRPVVGAIIAAGLGSDAFAISRIKDKPDISAAELGTLNTNILSPIDRWALNQNTANHSMYANISDLAQIPIILLPGLLAFDKNISKDWWDILLMYAEGHTITFTFYNYSPLGPTFENKYRPITYYTQLPLSDRESGNNRNSFYSGHTASCAYSTFFMAKVWCDYHPEMTTGEKYLLYFAASLPPIAMGYLRVRALDHFPSDCAVGYMLGAAIGIIIPELHKFHNNNLSLGMFSSPDGTGLNIKWTLTHKKPTDSNNSRGNLLPGNI